MLKVTHYGEVTRFDLARTIAGIGRYWTTAYRVSELLIDTGCAHSAPELIEHLKDCPLTDIINTHTHEDHIGANGLLQANRPELRILAHPLALPVLSDPRGRQPLHPYRRVFWGWPQPSKGTPLEDGATVQIAGLCFQIIYTPGHSADHICLYEPEQGWLFTGDLFVGGRDRALRAGCDVWAMIASTKLIGLLPTRMMFPGSARVRQNPQDEIAARAGYLEDQGRRVLELHSQGFSVDEIARRVFGGTMWIEWITLGHFSRRWLVRSYLESHRTQGEADR
jgi:glyoxylase-like metal-dependent hydrolase (beta-lactamase superfamily II)